MSVAFANEMQQVKDGTLNKKYEALKDYFKAHAQTGVAVAFSGGIDSTLLLYVAHQTIGERACAYNATASIFPPFETCEAYEFCQSHNIAYKAVSLDPLSIDGYRENPANRCYLCKHMIFSTLIDSAYRDGFGLVVDGSNASDNADERPGMKALVELGVKSPLRELGFTKDDIRALSRQLGLAQWDKGSFACLMTRFAQNQHVSDSMLHMVAQAESYLLDLGFKQFRVRWHPGNHARIELGDLEMNRALEPRVKAGILKRFSNLGFAYVSLDLSGFHSGSMARSVE